MVMPKFQSSFLKWLMIYNTQFIDGLCSSANMHFLLSIPHSSTFYTLSSNSVT